MHQNDLRPKPFLFCRGEKRGPSGRSQQFNLSCSNSFAAEGCTEAPEHPQWTNEQVDGIPEKGRLVSLNDVAQKLEGPTDHKQTEAPPPTKKDDRKRKDDHRNADRVGKPVQRMLMFRLVLLHECKCHFASSPSVTSRRLTFGHIVPAGSHVSIRISIVPPQT